MNDPPPDLPLPVEPLAEALPARAERYPFWDYRDALAFLLLAIPTQLAGALIVRSVYLFSAVKPSKAFELLPGQFLGYALWFACLFLLLKGKYDRSFWRPLGWVTPSGSLILSLMLGVPLAFAIAALGALLRTPEIEMPFRELLSDRLSILLVGVSAVTIGPVFEELTFRGFLFPLIARTTGVAPAIVLTALPFALLHGPQYGWSWRHLLLITFAGCAFGCERYRTGSTLAAALMHSTYNATFFFGYLLLGMDRP
jgi:membrane protease YdiL (CAAX protease family)